jgi:hypothetical protein
MKIYELLKKYGLVDDEKEFMELFYMRALYLNDVMITDLDFSDNIEKIRIGMREISLK